MKVSEIRIDGGTQPRDAINHDVVAEYTEALHNGAEFPPVVVFYDGADYWLADGFHRLAAHRVAKREDIEVDVHQGTRREAILYSVSANANHGLRRTPADKRRAVMALLNDDEGYIGEDGKRHYWHEWSDREIARQTNTSHPFVEKVRQSLTGNVTSEKPTERTYTTKHGTTAKMNTGKIGSNRPIHPGVESDEEPEEPEYVFDEWEEEPEEAQQPKPLVDIGGIPPHLYSRATTIGGNVQRFSEMTTYDPVESARGFKEHEKARVVDNARKIIGWLNRLVDAVEDL